MANDDVLGPRKTMFVLVIVVGCFAVLWPRILSPLILGSAREQLKPNKFDREAGCCEVIFETEVAVLELVNEVCSSAVGATGKLSPYAQAECRRAVNETCGLDIAAFMKRNENVGKTTKVLLETMKSSNSSCLKEHFGVPVWSFSSHPAQNTWSLPDKLKQERSPIRGMGPHPALRERGRAIPVGAPSPAPRPVPLPPHARVRASPLSVYYELDIKPPPIPGMRPPLGSPGGPVAAPKSSMGFVMPIYTICIIVFFVYTLSKILFKRTGSSPYEPVAPDPHFRRRVFRDESRSSPETKLGDVELEALRARLAETERAMQRIVSQLGSRDAVLPSGDVQDNHTRSFSNGTVLSNGTPIRIIASEYREQSKDKSFETVVEEEPSPETKETTPEPKEETPEPKELTTESKEPTSELIESTLKEESFARKEASPEPEDVSPKTKDVSPQSKSVSPEPKDVSPEPSDVSPQSKSVSPEPKDVSPEPKDESPEPVALISEPIRQIVESKDKSEEPIKDTKENVFDEKIRVQESLTTELSAKKEQTLGIGEEDTEILESTVEFAQDQSPETNKDQPEARDSSEPETLNAIASKVVKSEIEKETDKLVKLTQDLLDDARIEATQELQTKSEKQSTPELLEEALKEDLDGESEEEEDDDVEQENASVKVVGMEVTAHTADGGAWPRAEPPPVAPASAAQPRAQHEAEDVKSIYLQTEIPQQSRVLVADFKDTPSPRHSPLVVSGKMTLSLIQDAPRETPEREPESTVDEFTTASAFTQNAAEKEDDLSDEEVEEEIEIEEIEEEMEEEEEPEEENKK